MSMSDASSGPAEWAQLYRGGRPAPAMFGRVSDSDSTVVTTITSSPIVTGSAASSGGAAPGIEGRVGKSARKRSRASRRAPTTLLNTDTANFRAMVQQFTGIPSRPYTAGYQPAGSPIINFGHNFSEQLRHNTQTVPFSHLQQQQYHQFQQFQQQQQQQYQPPEQQQQHEGSLFTLGNNTNQVYLQGFSSNPSRINLESSEGFFLDGQVMPRQPSTDGRTGGYLL